LGWVHVLLLLLFPTGRLPSPRWRPVAWALVTGFVVTLISQGLKPGSLVDYSGEQNPLGTPALRPVLGPLEQLVRVLVIGGIIGAFASLAVRLRRSRGRERQQLKWFVYVALVGIVAIFPLGALLGPLIGQLPSSYGTVLGFLLNPWLLAPVALAVTVAAAIVRHRLYDIDRVINRTLVYALLTLLLGAVYTAGVFLLGRLLAPGDGQSELAIAASTLAVAALFRPARRQVQRAVDRRFNRARYDAAKTVAAFSTRLRDEIDLDTLSTELLAVVNQTVQPTQVSFWLRPMSMKSPPKAQPSNEANVA
jgi:succinate dehydrogenase hydrophobic anchor subunit